jgi:hypothetical protein
MSTEKDTPAQTILQDRPRDKMVAHIAANPGPAWDVLVDQENEIARLQDELNLVRKQLNVSDSYARETRSHPNVPTEWELQNSLVRSIVDNALAWNTTSYE